MAHFERFFYDSLLTYRNIRCGAILEAIDKLHSYTKVFITGVRI
jgi:hypothetical protein